MANQASKATAPTVDGKVYHLRLAKGDVPPYVVLPGDQAATEHISAVWQDTKEIAYNREYRTVTGVYEGFDMAMTSTGRQPSKWRICSSSKSWRGAVSALTSSFQKTAYSSSFIGQFI